MKLRKGRKVNNEGSAMIVAIVVSMVVMAFCLSLLLVAYSLFNSTVKKNKIEQCKSVMETYSISVDKSLTVPVYTDINKMNEDFINAKNNLWFYLRYNINQENWPDYVSEEESGHDMKAACRYFDLNLSSEGEGFQNYSDNITTCIYWEKVFGFEASSEESNDDLTEYEDERLIKVHVKMTCKIDDLIYEVENVYDLTITENDMDENEDEDNSLIHDSLHIGTSSVNPSGNEINESERWVFTFDERK